MVIRILHAERDRNKNTNFRRTRVEAVKITLDTVAPSAGYQPHIWHQSRVYLISSVT